MNHEIRAYGSLTISNFKMYMRNPIASSSLFLALLVLLFLFKVVFASPGPHTKLVVVDASNGAAARSPTTSQPACCVGSRRTGISPSIFVLAHAIVLCRGSAPYRSHPCGRNLLFEVHFDRVSLFLLLSVAYLVFLGMG